MTRLARLRSDGGLLRRSKSVGFLGIALGLLLIVGAAVLPVSPITKGLGPFHVDLAGPNCGPAGYVVFHKTGTVCGDAAERRLLATTAVGLLVLALGMALFAGGDTTHGSRVQVVTARPGPRARGRNHSRGRIMPG